MGTLKSKGNIQCTVGPFALIPLIFRHFSTVSLDKFWTYFIGFVIISYFSDTFFWPFLAFLGPIKTIFWHFSLFKAPEILPKNEGNFFKMPHCAKASYCKSQFWGVMQYHQSICYDKVSPRTGKVLTLHTAQIWHCIIGEEKSLGAIGCCVTIVRCDSFSEKNPRNMLDAPKK